MEYIRQAWFYVTSPFIGPGTAAAILREIENLDYLAPLIDGHDSKAMMGLVKLHLRQRMRKILKIYD